MYGLDSITVFVILRGFVMVLILKFSYKGARKINSKKHKVCCIWLFSGGHFDGVCLLEFAGLMRVHHFFLLKFHIGGNFKTFFSESYISGMIWLKVLSCDVSKGSHKTFFWCTSSFIATKYWSSQLRQTFDSEKLLRYFPLVFYSHFFSKFFRRFFSFSFLLRELFGQILSSSITGYPV